MSLRPGTRLGPYEVVAPIGSGGMGEVYKARDTRLDRIVAVKVLSEQVARDPDLKQRFEREARAVAALEHPHICVLHDIGQQDGLDFLVMEYLEGETLAQRLTRSPLPLDQALQYATQIADALAAAHRQGIVHRDLKPGNIMLTKSSAARQGSPQAKLLDFGLAKLRPANLSTPLAGLSAVPTEQGLTAQGTILGTLQYMAPEQLEGKEADARTDIFAFGAVVYEMLTGKKAFEGKSQASLLSAIMSSDPPPISAVQPLAPPALDRVVKKCLAKDPETRWQTARDLVDELQWVAQVGSQADVSAPVIATREGALQSLRLAWTLVAAVTVIGVAALAFGALAYFQRARNDAATVRFSAALPDGWSLPSWVGGSSGYSSLAVSRDGRRVAFVAESKDGKNLLWVRSLDALTPQALTGTDGASSPFWSPDGRVLGFFADGKLKKIDVSGGAPITLSDAPDNRGGTWNQDDVIVFAPTIRALQKVSAAGGVPAPATKLGRGETYARPQFLPDGRHFLYHRARNPGQVSPFYLTALDATDRTLLMNSDTGLVFYSQGHLLFLRGTTLMAQPFDAAGLTLTGEEFPIAEEIYAGGNTDLFAASENGVLAYQTGTAQRSTLVWFDRAVKQIAGPRNAGDYGDLELSPDGKRAAITVPEPPTGTSDVWIYDVARGLRTRLTFDSAGDNSPVWSPDGSRIVFASNRKGNYDLYQKASSGAGSEEPLLQGDLPEVPESWSLDGRYVLYQSSDDLWVLPLSGDRKPFPFLQTPFIKNRAKFSPDGRWVAYTSNESGQEEVYVAPFPKAEGKWQISTAGGSWSRWRQDGKEIFYLAPDNKLMAVEVNGQRPGFQVGAVRPLLQTRAIRPRGYAYDVSADGQRFLVNTLAEETSSTPITVVVNWPALLKK